MKNSLTIIAILVLLFSLSSGMESERFDKLLQLRGTWAMQTKKGPLYEEWKKTKENEISGKSYRLKAADTVLLERVTLKEEGGDIYYIPTVQNQNNQQPVTFKLISVDGNKFTFENKLHDFPQRIIYNLVSSDSIAARIEGTKNGNTGGSDFYFKRIK
jgi:hypothetical protein